MKTRDRISKNENGEMECGGKCQRLDGTLSERYLQLEVELHVAPARVVGVLLEDEPERRLPQVQVAVLQQELLLGLRPGHQPVLHLVVPAGGGSERAG